MSKERIETGPAPTILVSCQGDLVIKSWSESAVGIKGSYDLDESEKVWNFTSQDDLQLHIPVDSALHISSVNGDLVVKHDGEVVIEAAQGDVVLRGLSSAKVGPISGDVSIRHISGPAFFEVVHGDFAASHTNELSIGEVNGDFSGRHINGSVTIKRIAGDADFRAVSGDITVTSGNRDLNLSAVTGTVTVSEVEGDIRLKGGLQAGNHVLNAKRDIVVRWPDSLPVNLIATAPFVENRAHFDEFEQKGDAWIGRIGESKTNVELTAGRQIQLKDAETIDPRWGTFEADMEDFEFEFGDLGERISAQINEKMNIFAQNMEQQFGPDFGQEIGEKMARKAEKAAQRAERAAERAMQRAEKASRAKYGREWQGFYSPSAPASPTPPNPVSPEEQLKILRMVEKGTISPEEASMLLEALEA
ncbi:MAG: DUF4097 family beta strand repeat-containing protein [Chloroflexota bacterium]